MRSGRCRGDEWLAWFAALDRPEEIRAVAAPAPRPPVAARPRRLSVTEIETLIRDPYAIYARRVLGLDPLPALDADPGAAERGSFIHEVLDAFVRAHPGELPPESLALLIELGRETFGRALARPGVRAFWWPRFERIARWFVCEERARRERVRRRQRRGEVAERTDVLAQGPCDELPHHVDGGVEVTHRDGSGSVATGASGTFRGWLRVCREPSDPRLEAPVMVSRVHWRRDAAAPGRPDAPGRVAGGGAVLGPADRLDARVARVPGAA